MSLNPPPPPAEHLFYKIATRGHFVLPIDAKNHRVIVIWDLKGYGKYEFDWCICDQVIQMLACGGGGDGGDGKCVTFDVYRFGGLIDRCSALGVVYNVSLM